MTAQCDKLEVEHSTCLKSQTDAHSEADKLSQRLHVIQKLLESFDDLGKELN
ncbi:MULTISPECIES: hypothetical protein [Mycobacterium]|uniref:hypothetical protein n=1 Tax=Mycobacterium TaxID=1763 RepID=UPI0012E178BC|nr:MULTISPECIES: hypothetical protein [Mycobacterium]MDP7729439.1 hypothetical protein [Mycobacterium sp. TY813]